MKNVSNQQYYTDLAEKCRKALEVSFGEIPMPKYYSKRKLVSRTKSVGKRKLVSRKNKV